MKVIVAALLALAAVGAIATTSAASAASCGDAIGARWHVKHYFYRYDSHGAVDEAQDSREPASGDRYVVSAGSSADCRVAHRWMRRLTVVAPDPSTTDRAIDGEYVPIGEGLLPSGARPPGFTCIASLRETRPASQKGDNRHFGLCTTASRQLAFIWTAALPGPERDTPH